MTTATITRQAPDDVADSPERTDAELLALVHTQPLGSRSREEACEILVTRYQSLVRSCVLRYRESPEPVEELMQVGYVGLLKAINNFDPDIGGSLAAYAQPCVSGEIKRHFRDKRWQVHVRRSAQELRLEIRKARTELAQQLCRMPADAELASHLGISAADLLDAQRADLAFQASSLDAPLSSEASDGGTLADMLGWEDPRIENTLEMDAVWAHLGELPEREQNLLLMRFYGNMTQSEIGNELGISQMHVSRLLSHALGFLRDRMLAGDDQDLGAR
ncbi:MAG TPA: SigB/SigF/SigG family RNA polymerase sigma factor [Streptosporangiaceae bacterium]|nr:SigB/SigF/SigG family RNA polymerase sigma factor [Streptosporangiaceae bacterium]